MTAQERPADQKPRTRERFARVYYDRLMAEYTGIYRDPALLGTWLQLLVRSEQAWPGVPELPRSVRPALLEKLKRAGLVRELALDTFELRGFAAERGRRQAAGSAGAAGRWDSDRTTPALQSHTDRTTVPDAAAMPEREEKEKEKEFPPPPTAWGRRKDNENPRAIGRSPRQTGNSPRDSGMSPRQLRDLEKRGPTRLGEIIGQVAGHSDRVAAFSARPLVGRGRDE